MQSSENKLKNGQKMIGFFYMTMLYHIQLIEKKYLARHSVTTLEHPLYSQNLAQEDFYLFPWLKLKLKDTILWIQMRWSKAQWSNWRIYQKTDSRSVLHSYTNAGRSVWIQEKSTLKANNVKLLVCLLVICNWPIAKLFDPTSYLILNNEK